MRIAFLTAADAREPYAWSGTPYYMARALSKHAEVSHIGPVPSIVDTVHRAGSRIARAFLGHGIVRDHSRALAREYARRLRGRIRGDADLVVAPAGSALLAYLRTEVPVFFTSDATFRLVRDYYPLYSGLPEGYAREADDVERRALERSAYLTYPSAWAARSAVRDYGIPVAKVRVIPYGANLTAAPSREVALSAKKDPELRLLFLGGDWERKGGPTAFAATALLREAGLDARLTVCGCVPPEPFRGAWMECIPRLDKRRAADEARLSRLLLESAFLFVPSRSECYGIVFCEASAHGTPSIARDTGGISGAVEPERNGLLLPAEAGPDAYASAIAELFRDRDRYRRLVAGSRAAYEERLNWDAWARGAVEFVRSATPDGRGGSLSTGASPEGGTG